MFQCIKSQWQSSTVNKPLKKKITILRNQPFEITKTCLKKGWWWSSALASTINHRSWKGPLGSSSPTSCPKHIQLEQVAQGLHQLDLEIFKDGGSQLQFGRDKTWLELLFRQAIMIEVSQSLAKQWKQGDHASFSHSGLPFHLQCSNSVPNCSISVFIIRKTLLKTYKDKSCNIWKKKITHTNLDGIAWRTLIENFHAVFLLSGKQFSSFLTDLWKPQASPGRTLSVYSSLRTASIMLYTQTFKISGFQIISTGLDEDKCKYLPV